MIDIQERGDGYWAKCTYALGYGASKHDAVDDMILALVEFISREGSSRIRDTKAKKLLAEARELSKSLKSE